MRVRRWMSIVFVLPAILLAGCSGGSPTSVVGGPVPAPNPVPVPVPAQAGAVTIAPKFAALGVSGTTQFTATLASGSSGTVQWLVNGVQGGSSSTGTISSTGLYTAPASFSPSQNVLVTAQLASAPASNYAQSLMSLIAAGVVTQTTNPQVAQYSIDLPTAGSVTVNFGKTTAYGFPTSAQSTTATAGATVPVYVAGMLGQTVYHMAATVALSDGATFTDSDHTFTTGTPPATPTVVAATMNSGNPQPGIEIFDTALPQSPAMAFTTDLSGNVLWTYVYNGTQQDFVQPIRLLPNGNFLVQISYLSSTPLHKGVTVLPNTLDEVREVDLVGNTLHSLTAASIIAAVNANANLSSQLTGTTLGSLHHDVLALPNGHMVLLLSSSKTVNVSPAINGISGPTTVLGDVLVDVDQNFNPDWVWNAFNYLDPNRAPWPAQYPDWTHSNALLYSSDDGNLLLSIRHQNWIVKIDFADATGTGAILWKLGQGGDFTLAGGTDPTDWFYAQHGPNFFTSNTTGIFTLGVMDNGDDREFPNAPSASCPAAGVATAPTSQCYSTAEVLQVNEAAKTATILENYQPSPPVFSFFGGDVRLLPNGDREVDFATPVGGAFVQELRGATGQEQVVWQAATAGFAQYRTRRLPSMYPGVQW